MHILPHNFPAFKLATLAFKQIGKYIANGIKNRAKAHPYFKNYICIPPAQAYNYLEVKTKMWSMKLGAPTQVKPLSEAAAIELGAEILGEFILFAIAAGVMMFEFKRSKRAERRKQAHLRHEKHEVLRVVGELKHKLQTQELYIQELIKALEHLGKNVEVENTMPAIPMPSQARDIVAAG